MHIIILIVLSRRRYNIGNMSTTVYKLARKRPRHDGMSQRAAADLGDAHGGMALQFSRITT